MLKTNYVCENCGNVTAKWYGKCPSCGAWNSLAEQEAVPEPAPSPKARRASARNNTQTVEHSKALRIDEITFQNVIRFLTGLGEFDRCSEVDWSRVRSR